MRDSTNAQSTQKYQFPERCALKSKPYTLRCAALPFLRDAVYFLYPAGVVIVLYILSLLLGINCSILTMNLYFS